LRQITANCIARGPENTVMRARKREMSCFLAGLYDDASNPNGA
jgi:hypothetical protein